MLSDVAEGSNLMFTKLPPVATLVVLVSKQKNHCRKCGKRSRTDTED